MSDGIALLDGVMTKTAALVSGVARTDWPKPTPCPDYDVGALLGHLCGWVQVFAAAAAGETFQGDPTSYDVSAGDPAADFRESARRLVVGWREHGTDRTVTMLGGAQPAELALNMALMEFVTHGWDLAVATEQPVPYTEAEASAVLERAQQTLPAQYRGPDKPFGDIVDVAPDAPAILRLIGFMGRSPGFGG